METIEQGAHAAPPVGKPIPVPPDFPVSWKAPEWEGMFWQRDRMHFPDPLHPLLTTVFIDEVFSQGFAYGANAHSLPIRLVSTTQNGYMYQSAVPQGSTPEEMEALGQAAQAALGRAMPTQIERWNNKTLPEILDHLAAWDRMDLQGASLEELRQYVDESVERIKRVWQLHFYTVTPALPSVSFFDDMCRDLFADDPDFAPFRLIQGIPTKITEMGLALWTLSRTALESAEVRRVLEEEAAADVVPALEQTDDGRRFLVDLRAYLDEFGQRGNSAFALSDVSWIEDPTPVIKMLKDYVGQPDRDLEAEAEALIADREQAIADARATLANYPEQVRGQFEALLDAATQGMFIAEEHNYYIDYLPMYRVRLVMQEVGRRLVAAGSLQEVDDVFFLTLDEVRQALENPADPGLAGTVERAKAEHARHWEMQPPPMLGTMPPGPPPSDPLTLALMKFFGGPPQTTEEPNAIQGTPGSPGVVRGPARVLRSLRDADRLQRGDILVAETTAVPWTPHFATVAGVVTDTGGPLSHSAVAAREYGIPAVVGTTMGTAVIRDGQQIEVDGLTGLVRMLDQG